MKKVCVYKCKQEVTVEYAYMGYALDDVLDYIDTAPTIEVKDNG